MKKRKMLEEKQDKIKILWKAKISIHNKKKEDRTTTTTATTKLQPLYTECSF
jgi:hypothetical protein